VFLISPRPPPRGLRDLGVAPGAVLGGHASLGSLGWVEGGAGAVIGALLEAVGEEGTLVMSTYLVGPPLPLTGGCGARAPAAWPAYLSKRGFVFADSLSLFV